MANRYWVGGSGTWDATTTTNWSATNGGSGGASAPTSADTVDFTSLSNATLYTVTVGTNANGGSITVAAPATGAVTFSLSATSVINCYGSFTLPAINCTWTAASNSTLGFLATTTGNTVTTNGVSLSNSGITFNGAGGGWTLGSALTNTTQIVFAQGTFNTGNFNITCVLFNNSFTSTRTINLGSSVITCTNTGTAFLSVATNLTFNAGTSTINLSNNQSAFSGGGLTYYNVGFTSNVLIIATINGANTFNNLTFASRASTGIGLIIFPASTTQTITGTLTLGSGTTGNSRNFLYSSTVGTQTTLSVAAISASLTDLDFRDVIITGAVAPISGTRLGNGLNNSGITFVAGTTKYWVSTAGDNWTSAVWNTVSGNTGGTTTNFPLIQDNIVIDNAGLGSGNTITITANFNIPTISFATRTNPVTLNTTGQALQFYGNVTLSSAVTQSGAGTVSFTGKGLTQQFTSAGVTWNPSITVANVGGTFQLVDALTIPSTATFTLTNGTLNLNNFTLTAGLFNSNNTNVRTIAFDTGSINLTGNNAFICIAITTNLTVTGTPVINSNYSGSTGTRSIVVDGTVTNYLTQTISVNVTAGSDLITVYGFAIRNLNYTGFSGQQINYGSIQIYGDMTLSATMTTANPCLVMTLTGAAGVVQTVTSNGVIWNANINFGNYGSGTVTYRLNGALTVGSTYITTLNNGTLDLTNNGAGNYTLTTGKFDTFNGGFVRSINFGVSGTIVVTATGNAFNVSNSANFTTTGTGLVSLTNATSATFVGGGGSYPTFNAGSTGTYSITGANTFKNMTNTAQPCTITFPASTTTTCNDFNLNGTAGNLVTLNSSIPGTRFTLSKI